MSITAADLEKQISELKTLITNDRRPAPVQTFGAPSIRKGASVLSSSPFYISKLTNVVMSKCNPDEMALAKNEIETSNRFRKAMAESHGLPPSVYGNSFLVPLDWSHIPDEVKREEEFVTLRKAMQSAVEDIDPDIVQCRQMVDLYDAGQRVRLRKAAMSYQNQQTGGAMVAPPEFGELIPILRNKSVIPNIGARQYPLPPQGEVQFPRQTAVSTAYNVPENVSGTESSIETDDVTLRPKQFIGLVRTSNQLLRFAPSLAEAAIREDMMQQIALTFDYQCLQGTGAAQNTVRGLINHPNISNVTAKVIGTNGNTLAPVDCSRMIAAAQKRNSDIKTFVMVPDMWLGITEFRGDAVTPGDKAGMYLFNILREFGDNFATNWRQRKVVTSNNVARNRAKGSATNLTYILGVDGDEVMVGMHGAIQIDMNPYETTAFSSNQTLIRTILFGDIAVRRAAGLVLMDQLVITNLDS